MGWNSWNVFGISIGSYNRNMKILICSDIHGSESRCKKVVHQFEEFRCDKMIILGDILYHGPRNPLPEGHNPKGVVEILNAMKDKIIACRGNCDAEVDQMVLKFSLMADYVQLVEEGVTLFCTHGHVYAPVLGDGNQPKGTETAGKRPLISKPGVVFYGHTHVPVLEKNLDDILICNPGSTSLPKEESKPGFAIYEKGTVSLYDLDGNLIKKADV